MAFSSVGNAQTERISFNSGTINFGNSQIVDVESVKVSVTWNTAPLYVLNSVKMVYLARHSLSVSISGKIASFSPTIEAMIMGSSSAGSPNTLTTLDGQATLQSPILTLYDQNANEIQYQVTGAVFKSQSVSTNKEDYTTWDFEIEAKDITLLYT